MSHNFDLMYAAVRSFDLPIEDAAKYQTVPRDGRLSVWTGDDGCAIIFGLGGGDTVDFLFDSHGEFQEVRCTGVNDELEAARRLLERNVVPDTLFQMVRQAVDDRAELARQVKEMRRELDRYKLMESLWTQESNSNRS